VARESTTNTAVTITAWVLGIALIPLYFSVLRGYAIDLMGRVNMPLFELLGIISAFAILGLSGFLDKVKYRSPWFVSQSVKTSIDGTVHTVKGMGDIEYYIFRMGGSKALSVTFEGNDGVIVAPDFMISRHGDNYVGEVLLKQVPKEMLPPNAQAWVRQHDASGPYYFGLAPLRFVDHPLIDIVDGDDIKDGMTSLESQLQEKNRLVASYQEDLKQHGERQRDDLKTDFISYGQANEDDSGGK